MLSLRGYINDGSIIAEDSLPAFFNGKEVIITILDSFKRHTEQARPKKYTDEDVDVAFGIWKNHNDSANVDEYVRQVRRGRNFDI